MLGLLLPLKNFKEQIIRKKWLEEWNCPPYMGTTLSKDKGMALLGEHKSGSLKSRGKRIVTCAFCQGKGIDPFDFLAPSSKCLVCLGRGNIEIEEPSKQCAYCEGTGIQPYGSMLVCIVCRGKGVVTIKEPNKICPECEGSGRSQENGIPCLKCKGIGVVAEKTTQKER